ncbi:MAG TPA: ABC transporter substrate-binding protein, partial [Nitriliruptorales bacterium]
LGLLEGRNIGVLDSEFPSDKEASEQGLLATLDALGYEVTHRHTTATNLGEAQAQVPVAVSEMQRKNVEVVFLAANFVVVQSFVNQAASRNFYPQYLASDFGQIATDKATTGFDAAGFDGAIAFSMLRSHGFKAGLAPNALERDCMDRHERAHGSRFQPDESQYAITVVQCGLIDTLVRALDEAGTVLTRERFTAAQLSFGAFDIGTLHPLSWGRDKYTGGDYLWAVQWQAGEGCPDDAGDGCWYPIDDVRPRPV